MIYSNYAINISVIIGSIIAVSTKTQQFISVAVLKLFLNSIPEKLDSGRIVWTLKTLDAWTHGLRTLGLCKPGSLDSGRVDSGRVGAWNVVAWTQENQALGRLESGRLEVRALNACMFGLWTPERLGFAHLDAQITDKC